ncbi:hypothetical protein CQ10_27585 [Bradyrhizobium valentinum]|uniref:Transposase n=1 Tax=Bradyrhizobium valentinum TaxID=1518501 RepID=A0A0R3KRV4_9BRAD|nr:hypothetical protein CQ10_27585 [Bradyrhizobium valentinum]KRQ98584.1 hypothetical protein CP49_24230 [Bradyrhizobium valentinum]
MAICFKDRSPSELCSDRQDVEALSWINQVERWFAELTRKQIQRGVHTSVRQLEADSRTFIDQHNKYQKPFKWTKSAYQILASVKRFCHKAQETLCGEL